MLNTVYQLKRPRQFEAVFKRIDMDDSQIFVRPTYLSICNADQRYYQGTRNKEVLKQKLPMALIHEGIGKVVYDPTDTFQVGESVIMIPNIPEEQDEVVAENYLLSSRFCASGEDGFMREFVTARPDRLLKLPENINPYVAAFTELVSVAYHAVNRFDRSAHMRRKRLGVWGDGHLVINGGTFTAHDNTVIGTNGTGYDTSVKPYAEYSIEINGGTFNANIESSGYIACGIYAANAGSVVLRGGTFNINGGVGILVRGGSLDLRNAVIINNHIEGLDEGKVGDSTVLVSDNPIVVDYSSEYPDWEGINIISTGDYEPVIKITEKQ